MQQGKEQRETASSRPAGLLGTDGKSSKDDQAMNKDLPAGSNAGTGTHHVAKGRDFLSEDEKRQLQEHAKHHGLENSLVVEKAMLEGKSFDEARRLAEQSGHQ